MELLCANETLNVTLLDTIYYLAIQQTRFKEKPLKIILLTFYHFYKNYSITSSKFVGLINSHLKRHPFQELINIIFPQWIETRPNISELIIHTYVLLYEDLLIMSKWMKKHCGIESYKNLECYQAYKELDMSFKQAICVIANRDILFWKKNKLFGQR